MFEPPKKAQSLEHPQDVGIGGNVGHGSRECDIEVPNQDADAAATDTAAPATADEISCAVGYDRDELDRVPEGANLGLGCGNPVALASLVAGETVLDLGSGAGFDCFLAAERVGPRGRVIGVDMTPEMVERARANALKGGFANVEFRLGEIEALPVADGIADIVISNCVLNLSPDRPRVLAEALRALKPGGRVMISDLVSDHLVPDFVATSKDSLVGRGALKGLAQHVRSGHAGHVVLRAGRSAAPIPPINRPFSISGMPPGDATASGPSVGTNEPAVVCISSENTWVGRRSRAALRALFTAIVVEPYCVSSIL